jgi:hypothetical protein
MATHKAILLIGRSGSGKTRIAADLVKEQGGRAFVVNDKTDQTDIPKIEWSDVESLHDATLVVEDLIACKNSSFEALQKVLNFSAHHKNLRTIIIIAHSVVKTNTQGLLGFITHCYFTLAKSNVKSISTVLDYYKFDKSDKARMIAEFVADTDKFGHYILDVERRTFKKHVAERISAAAAGPATAAKSSADRNRRSKEDLASFLGSCRESASRLIPLLGPDSDKGWAVYEILIALIPLKDLSAHDLSIKLHSRSAESNVSVNLIDYIFYLCTDKVPPPRIKKLHSYFKKYCNIPACIIDNERLSRNKKRR